MRLLRILLGLVAVTATLAAVADAAAARSVRAAGPIVAFGVTGAEVAFATEQPGGCHEIRVWDTRDRGVRRYARHCFAVTSTGGGVAAVAVAGRRAVWLTYTGGNIREWSLWTRSRTSRARRIAFVTRDADAPRAPLVVGRAHEGLLVYATDSTVVALRPDGSRAFSWGAEQPVAALTAEAHGVAAVLADGTVVTLSPSGGNVQRHELAGEVEAAFAVPGGVAAVTDAGLVVRTRGGTRTLGTGRNARFVGFADGVLLYSTGDQLRSLRLRDGRDALFRRVTPGGFAGYDRLAAAWTTGRTILLEPGRSVRGR